MQIKNKSQIFENYKICLKSLFNSVFVKAVSLEKSYEGASRILVEDKQVLATLESIR